MAQIVNLPPKYTADEYTANLVGERYHDYILQLTDVDTIVKTMENVYVIVGKIKTFDPNVYKLSDESEVIATASGLIIYIKQYMIIKNPPFPHYFKFKCTEVIQDIPLEIRIDRLERDLGRCCGEEYAEWMLFSPHYLQYNLSRGNIPHLYQDRYTGKYNTDGYDEFMVKCMHLVHHVHNYYMQDPTQWISDMNVFDNILYIKMHALMTTGGSTPSFSYLMTLSQLNQHKSVERWSECKNIRICTTVYCREFDEERIMQGTADYLFGFNNGKRALTLTPSDILSKRIDVNNRKLTNVDCLENWVSDMHIVFKSIKGRKSYPCAHLL